MSNAVNAFGTLLKRNGTTIGEVTDISGPEISRDNIEVTHHQSPQAYREFIKGLKDAGEFNATINYIPTNSTHNAATGILSDLANNATVDTWSLVFPDSGATTWTFPGFLTKFSPKNPIDAQMSADITMKVSGAPTLA